MINKLKETLARCGVPDTRRESLADAMSALHSAVSQCDPDTRQRLFDAFPSALELADDYGRHFDFLRSDFLHSLDPEDVAESYCKRAQGVLCETYGLHEQGFDIGAAGNATCFAYGVECQISDAATELRHVKSARLQEVKS